jgi:tryptophan synthase alpha chain
LIVDCEAPASLVFQILSVWFVSGASSPCFFIQPSKINNTRVMSLSFSKKPSLVAYLTCGDPDMPTTREIVLAAIEAGADAIELGVPFSDPVADGPVIQRASERALRQETTLEQVLKLAAGIRQSSQVGLIVFTYLNPILRMGLAKFCAAAQEAGVDGALLTDLPVEEAREYLREMRKRALAAVFLAAPTSTNERLKHIAQASSGFVYAVSRTGVTGARKQLPEDARDLVERLRKYTKLPIAVGFGISTPAQFAAVGDFAEAAVVGSAIVETIERNPGREPEAVAQFVKQLVGRRSLGVSR